MPGAFGKGVFLGLCCHCQQKCQRFVATKEQHPREYGGAVGWWVVVGVMGRPWRRTSRRMRHPCVAVLVLSLVNANGFPEDEDANAH